MFDQDLINLSAQTLEEARTKGLKIVAAESCTGGLVGGLLTEIPGSSDVFERGFAAYSNHAKLEVLGVSVATLRTFGAVSPECAGAMAEGALKASRADLSVAVTGIAGPGGSVEKPEGYVCFATALKGGETLTREEHFGALGRTRVRLASVKTALEMLRERMF